MNEKSMVVKKVCIAKFCRKVDLTDFSTCRYCGSSYDPVKYRRDHVLMKSPFEFGRFIKTPRGFFVLMTIAGSLNYMRVAGLDYLISRNINKADSDIKALDSKAKYQSLSYEDLVRKGDAYWVQTRTNEACDAYTAAIQLQPKIPQAYEKRALMYNAMGLGNLADSDRKMSRQLH